MRVVGYVREQPGASDSSAFMQAERVRRWVATGGYRLVSICQDDHVPGSTARPGLDALLAVVEQRQADMVVVANLDALSPDKVVQEILLWELRRHQVSVASAEAADLAALGIPSADPLRMVVRDILARADELRRNLQPMSDPGPTPSPDVVVELLEPSAFRAARQSLPV